jgi:hypothetical protein
MVKFKQQQNSNKVRAKERERERERKNELSFFIFIKKRIFCSLLSTYLYIRRAKRKGAATKTTR